MSGRTRPLRPPRPSPTKFLKWLERKHGPQRARRAEWAGLAAACVRLHEEARRRKEAALLEALEALERARRYEESEEYWIAAGALVAFRVDEAEEQELKSRKLFEGIRFESKEREHDE